MSEPINLPVEVGRHVELEITYESGETEQLSLDLVPDASADFERGFLGESTPLAQFIHGQVAGSVLTYHMGDAVRVKVLSVAAELSAQPSDLTGRREETRRKAVRDSDHTNLVIFASSMNSKWGDYDPDGIKYEDDPEDDEEK